MPGKTDGPRYEDLPDHHGKAEGTHQHCPVELALSRYDGILVVEVQDKFPTGVRWEVG